MWNCSSVSAIDGDCETTIGLETLSDAINAEEAKHDVKAPCPGHPGVRVGPVDGF